MRIFDQYEGKMIEVELSSKKLISGKLIECGSDILVVFAGQQYVYLPQKHIHVIKRCEDIENEIIQSEASPIKQASDELSLMAILNNAKGIFVEVEVSGIGPIFGYITNVMSDYIVFYSPAWHQLFLPIPHLKSVTPYVNKTPYNLPLTDMVFPVNHAYAENFSKQVKQLQGELVRFDGGKSALKIGMLKNVENNLAELVIGNGQNLYLNINHIKSVQKAIG
jgi:hypothetical protein